MSRTIEHGSTNQRVRCRVLDVGGAPYEGLAYNATGIAVSYQRLGSAAASLSLVLGTGLNDDHADGKWNEIGDGWYQLDAPDAAFASGIDSVIFFGSATGYTFIFEQITLVTSQVYPANFASLGINGSGHISRVTLVDTTTTNTDMVSEPLSAMDLWTYGSRTITGIADDAIGGNAIDSSFWTEMLVALGLNSGNLDAQFAAVNQSTSGDVIKIDLVDNETLEMEVIDA